MTHSYKDISFSAQEYQDVSGALSKAGLIEVFEKITVT